MPLVILIILMFQAINLRAAAHEDELTIEQWMLIPFETESVEETVILECWMGIPFELSVVEEIITLESWMVEPFAGYPADQLTGTDQSDTGHRI